MLPEIVLAVSPIYDKGAAHACACVRQWCKLATPCTARARVYHKAKYFSYGKKFPLKCVPTGNSG
jgi:hypothetical protein